MSNSIAEKLQQAFDRFNARDLAMAERLCNEILSGGPQNPDALHLLGVIALQRADHARAVNMLQRAIAIRPDDSSYHSNLAYGYIGLERLAEAHEAFERAARLDPDDPDLQLDSGTCLAMMGKASEAEAAFRRLVERHPMHALGWFNLANAVRDQERYEEARNLYVRATQLAPRNAQARVGLGTALLKLGLPGAALDYFREAEALNADDPETHLGCGLAFLELGRTDEAVSRFQRALSLKPDYAEAWSNLGNVLTDLKRDDEALEAYRRAAHHNPNLAPIWSNLGGALRRGGHTGEAIEACRRSTALDPGFAPGWTNLGLALRDQGLLAEATKALSRAVELDPAFATWQNLGEVLETDGRLDGAEEAYRRALAAGTPTAVLLTKLGGILKRQGRVNDAIDTIKQALAIDPNHVPALAEIGQLLLELNRPEDAQTHYRTAVEAMLGAIGAGHVESALAHEYQIYHAFVQPVETEEHYRRCFSDWQAEMAALGERFRQTYPRLDANPREIAFFLHAGHVLGHTEVLLKLLEDPRARDGAGVTPRLYIFGTFDDRFLARVERLRVPFVLLTRELPRGAATPFPQRFSWLRERFRQDRIGVCVWVSSPLWVSFAFSMRLAPVQIFWALRFHPIAGPYIDGYITYGSRHERERIIGKQTWRVCPVPLTLDATPADPKAVAELRQRLPQGFLMGTLARPEKIDSRPFLESVAQILKTNAHAHYLWTGREEHAGIASFFRSAGVADRCHFVGWVDTPLYAAALDLFLESFPFGTGVVPYQALGAGVPLLSYFSKMTLFGVNFGHEFPDGAPENLERYPILCARSPEEYVQLANKLAANPEFRSQVAARGRQFFEQELNNLPSYSQRFFDTIAEIAADTLARRPATAG